MTKSSLALIDAGANDALTREMARETFDLSPALLKTIETKSRVKVVGFDFVDPAIMEKAQATAKFESRNNIDIYLRDRETLRGKLEARGITPKAILPGRVWDRLCRESGLVQLAPDDQNRVCINLNVVKGPDLGSMTGLLYAWALLGPLTIAGIVGASAQSLDAIPLTWAPLLVATVLFYVVCAVRAEQIGIRAGVKTTFRGQLARKFLRARIKTFLKQPWADVLRKLDPKPIGDRYYNSNSNAWVTVVLPEPPDSVIQTLSKAATMTNLRVAAVPEAIGFKENLTEMLWTSGAEKIVKAEKLLPRLDPMPYITEGLAVAILDQFGDFPIEQALVDKIMSTSFAP